MENSYWWPLAKSLAQFLQEYKDENDMLLFGELLIYAGSMLNAKTYPCIEIIWDKEREVKRNCGLVNLWIEICLQNNSDKPAEAYERMHRWQAALLQALPHWETEAKRDLGIAMAVHISGMASAGDLQRPVCQSRMMIEIEWRVSKL